MRKAVSTTLLLVGICIVLAGCGKMSPPSSYYVLTSTKAVQTQMEPLHDISVGVGPVTIPGHLDRSQIVTSTGQNSINIHEYQRWGDSFKTQIEETLAENLSTLLQTPKVAVYPWERAQRPAYQVYVTVRRFEGKSGMDVTLDAIWQLVDIKTEKSLLTRHFVHTEPALGTQMSTYVQAQSDALEALSIDIAKGLHTVHTQ
ncbi:PqiC family protein [Halodesulfovibrio sp.]|uniref:PqiC family protein n=1 Tax=Halodesulfovibrio sp. TaxID=1912772 RepID=UPI0025B7F242|nr:PqiC family protein [Halodesulfovibrio sp.]